MNFEPTEADDEKGEFSVHRSDGDGNSWETDRKPENALDDIQQRVRDYKRRSPESFRGKEIDDMTVPIADPVGTGDL